MQTEVALKVDVDTYIGARDGIPRLAELFGELGIVASFFVTMGPDNSGKAVRRIFTRKGFLQKMLRTKAPTTYGWRTMLYGTLLPPPLVGAQFPDVLKSLEQQGHEVGPHGWDHVHWHDFMNRMDKATTRREFEKGFRACEQALGHAPVSSAAPGWQCTTHSLQAQDELGLIYHSDTRGTHPFMPCIGGDVFRGIEIPTTLPTLDEVLGTPEVERDGAVNFFDQHLQEGKLNVFTIHTETEGMGYLDFLRELLTRWQQRGATFVRLIDVAQRLRAQTDALTRAEIAWGELPGRAGQVACQRPVSSE
jgi:peptidoglycan/xylan/chitin deacetylase (PgdA/CDA1 family)